MTIRIDQKPATLFKYSKAMILASQLNADEIELDPKEAFSFQVVRVGNDNAWIEAIDSTGHVVGRF